MKFWKSLSILIEETLPDWRDKFLSYKDLKKHLTSIHPKKHLRPCKRSRFSCTNGLQSEIGDFHRTKEVTDFARLLEDQMDKFNEFFIEKEEEYVIRWKELHDRVTKTMDSNEELMEIWREIVDFHGEMVLLMNYSALNYTGLVKILKKYDKRSGALIRLPFIQRVLQQPFYTTDLLDKLVKECEVTLDSLFIFESLTKKPKMCLTENIETTLKSSKELAEIENMESMYTKLTMSALRVLKEIRSGSSTVSVFSLPPLQNNGQSWECNPVLEQAAK